MRLQSGQRSLDSDSIMAHKLLPYPIFDADGQMHEAKTKANLKNVIKVEVSSRDADASFLDFFFTVLWVVLWPTSAQCNTIWTDYAVTYMDA